MSCQKNNIDMSSKLISNCGKDIKCIICKQKVYVDNELEAHCKQYYVISMNIHLVLDRTFLPGNQTYLQPLWVNFIRYTSIAIDQLVN